MPARCDDGNTGVCRSPTGRKRTAHATHVNVMREQRRRDKGKKINGVRIFHARKYSRPRYPRAPLAFPTSFVFMFLPRDRPRRELLRDGFHLLKRDVFRDDGFLSLPGFVPRRVAFVFPLHE